MGRTLLAVFAGLIVGLAVGFMLFQERATSPDVEVPTLHRSSGDSGSAREKPELARPSARPSGDAAQIELVSPSPARTETDAVESVRGSGEIWGRITDLDDVGVAGVLLRAEPIVRPTSWGIPRILGQGPPDRSLEKSAREAARNYAAVRAGLAEVRTDDTGHFRFKGLSATHFTVSGYKRGFVIESRAAQPSRVAVGSEIDFSARAVQSVPVRVLLPNGALAEEAMIMVSTELPGRMAQATYWWTPADSALPLTPGKVELQATVGQLVVAVPQTARRGGMPAEMHSVPNSFEVVLGATVGPVELRLESRIGIRGRMVFPRDGFRSTDGVLHLLRLEDNQPLDLEVLANAEPQIYVRCGRGYAFLDLAPGRYALGFQIGGSEPIVAHRVVDVSSGVVQCDIELPPLDLTGYLIARVLGPEGELLNEVQINLQHGQGYTGRSTRDADGNYCIYIPDPYRSAYYGSGDSDIPFRVEATHRLYGTTIVELTRGQAEVEVRYTQPAQLEVRVTGYVGSEYTGRLTAKVTRPGESPNSVLNLRSGQQLGPDGILQLGALQPGAYVLTLHLSDSIGGDDEPRTVATQSVQLAAGENTVSLALPPLYSLEVVVPGAADGTEVGLIRRAGDGDSLEGWRANCDEDGGVRFEDLLGGEYTIHMRGGIRGQMRIQVPCGTVVFEADRQ